MNAPLHTRRNFLRAGGATALALLLNPSRVLAAESAPALFSAMGIAASLDKAAALKTAGAQFLTESVGNFLVPEKDDAAFAKSLEALAASPLPVLACNGFIRPKDLHCVGPDANHDAILKWSDTCFRRLKQANGKFIVFGSAGARRIPDGWSKEKADGQFVELLKKLGPLAEAQGVTVVVEQLRAEECNFLNHISDGAKLIRAAGHPHVRLLADLYHMACGGDTPADLKAAMDVVVHLEIAEKEGRTAPGVSGDDFRPYFHVLRESKYQGAINIEGRWTPENIATAFKEIAKQAAEA